MRPSSSFGRLVMLMSLAALNGTIPVISASGLLRLENVLLIALTIIAGPAAFITASMLNGSISERIVAASLAGLTATILTIIAAAVGFVLVRFLDISVLQVASGLSVVLVGMLMLGVRTNAKLPLLVIFLGVVLSVLVRWFT
ncbi:hypothetical protein HY486_02295 [Candidatus Woesearchaeota archaeon]|nr:hypothetical protein [Candidatus Woesearchaeota archaeon]